jgi:hypothetical protein
VWDLDDQNGLHIKAKKKLLAFVEVPQKVRLGRTAERDLSLTPIRKLGLLQAMADFIACGAVLKADFMQQTGDEAFIFNIASAEESNCTSRRVSKGKVRMKVCLYFRLIRREGGDKNE